MKNNLSLRQLLLIFTAVFATLFVAATMAYNRLSSLVESNEAINQNNDFALKLEEVISYLKDAETGTRGYLLTSDTFFLQPQRQAGEKMKRVLVMIKRDAVNRNEEMPYIQSLERLADERIRLTDAVIATVELGQLKNISKYQKTMLLSGKNVMDSIRILVQDLKNIEIKRLNINKKQQTKITNSSPQFLLMIMIAAISVILITMWIIYRQLLLLSKAKTNLENKVQELYIANRELDLYAFALTHHLQEPLRKIRLFSSRYESKIQKINAPNQQEAADLLSIQKITALATESQNLLDEFLAFARLNQDAEKDVENIDLSKIIEDIWDVKKDLVQQTSAIYQVECTTKMKGNREKMTLLFQHLIDNALKFKHSDRDALIKIDCHEVLNEEQAFQIIHFSDNGNGFEQQYDTKVFALFQRLNNNTTYKGLGVGLAICRKVVEIHNGTISVQSTPDVGTVFTIKIPV